MDTAVPSAAPSREWSLLPVTARQAAVILRWTLLAVLLAAGAAALLTADPPRADLQSLLHDVRAGKVDTVEILDEPGDNAEARWSTGGLRWWTTPVDPATMEQEAMTETGSVDLRASLEQQARAAGHPIPIEQRSANALWTANLPWQAAMLIASGVWLLTFLWMLTYRDHRYANRWAWLWLFTYGLAGALLYLWLEPRPLWRRGAARDPQRQQRGGAGFLYAILLGIVVSLLAVAVQHLLGAEPRSFSGDAITPVLTGS